MKNIYLFMVLIILILCSSQNSFATYNSGGNGYNAPIVDGTIMFEGRNQDGKVQLSWNSYDGNEKFKYYKVIRSQSHNNPVYPDHGYIKYSSDINLNHYIDTKAKVGINYYRVCAITTEKNRYCSNVEKINVTSKLIGGQKDKYGCLTSAGYTWCAVKNKCLRTWEEKCTKVKPVNTSIPEKVKQKVNILVIKVIKNIEKKNISKEAKVKILNKINNRLNQLKALKPHLASIIDYLVEQLKQVIKEYENDLSDIEAILNDY